MPIYYACESEEQAKQECAKVSGHYTGRSYGRLFTWQTHTGVCVANYSRPTASGFSRYVVVYDKDAEAFLHIATEGDDAATTPFLSGGDVDAPSELYARYLRYLFEREEARRNEKVLLQSKLRSSDETRLRKIKGKTIQVVAGKTIKHGTTGRVFWIGFGEKGEARVGFTDDSGNRRWTALSNVTQFHELPLLDVA